MTEKERNELRFVIETQFRHKFYKDPKFPYLPSMGLTEILHGFGNEEVGFIGVLQLVYIGNGYWKGQWHDEAEYLMQRSLELEDERIVDMSKVLEIHEEKRRQLINEPQKEKIPELLN
jgi:hypothetical protein